MQGFLFVFSSRIHQPRRWLVEVDASYRSRVQPKSKRAIRTTGASVSAPRTKAKVTMKVTDILKGSDYALTIFTENEVKSLRTL